MNKTIRTGLLLCVSVCGPSACTSLVGGFDFDGKTGTTGGTASTSSTGGSGGMAATTTTATTTGGTGGMTSSSTGAGCSTPSSDCPKPATACVVASCDAQMQCATTNAAMGDPCNDSAGIHCDGNGKCVECVSATDCPPPANACVEVTCNAGVCNTKSVAAQTLISVGQPNDCLKQECDGNGAVTTAPNDTEVPDDAESCTTDTCVAGIPVHVAVAAGMACSENGGKKCGDGASPGTCVACNKATQAADCPSQVCQSNLCVPAACGDGLKNGTESDQDCGGPSCGTCIDGKMCGANGDCLSQVCNGGLCKVPTCIDGKLNGGETGHDCGNSAVTGCGLCPPNEGCLVPADCASGVCTNKICQAPNCADGIYNQGESDIDCGGPCSTCGFALTCASNTDCTTGYCIASKCDAKPLATGQLKPWAIAVDAQNVYWTTASGGGTGTVMKAPLGGGPAVALATGLDTPQGIALDRNTNPTTVFWVEGGAGTLKRVSAAGGAITTMATGQVNPFDVAVNATTAYWTNYGGGTVMKVASNVPGPTVPVQVNVIGSVGNLEGIALDANNVYWCTDETGTPPAVYGASLTTGVVTQLYAGIASDTNFFAVAADVLSGRLIFTESSGGGDRIRSVFVNGTSPVTVTTSNGPLGLAISGSTLYWAGAGNGTINKIGTNGVGSAVVAPGQTPRYIAVDATSVYWTNYLDGTIRKANK